MSERPIAQRDQSAIDFYKGNLESGNYDNGECLAADILGTNMRVLSFVSNIEPQVQAIFSEAHQRAFIRLQSPVRPGSSFAVFGLDHLRFCIDNEVFKVSEGQWGNSGLVTLPYVAVGPDGQVDAGTSYAITITQDTFNRIKGAIQGFDKTA